jgi:putative transposase
VARRINSFGLLETMADVMLMRGVPAHIRSDNGAEMAAKVVRNWLTQVGAKTLSIEPGSPWGMATANPSTENYAMSFSMERSSTA